MNGLNRDVRTRTRRGRPLVRVRVGELSLAGFGRTASGSATQSISCCRAAGQVRCDMSWNGSLIGFDTRLHGRDSDDVMMRVWFTITRLRSASQQRWFRRCVMAAMTWFRLAWCPPITSFKTRDFVSTRPHGWYFQCGSDLARVVQRFAFIIEKAAARARTVRIRVVVMPLIDEVLHDLRSLA